MKYTLSSRKQVNLNRMHRCRERGDWEGCVFFLQHVSPISEDVQNLFWIPCQLGNVQVVERLLPHMCSGTQDFIDGLYEAVHHHHCAVVHQLMAVASHRSSVQQLASYLMVEEPRKAMVDMLVEKCAPRIHKIGLGGFETMAKRCAHNKKPLGLSLIWAHCNAEVFFNKYPLETFDGWPAYDFLLQQHPSTVQHNTIIQELELPTHSTRRKI